MMWWWLSFADSDLPEGEQFLGVAIVPAYDIGGAALLAHLVGVNPGGQVMGFELPAECVPSGEHRMRLLSLEDLRHAGLSEGKTLGDLYDEVAKTKACEV